MNSNILSRNQQYAVVALSVIASLGVVWATALGASTISTNISTDGTLTVSGTTTFNTVAYTWPAADGSSGNILSTNGSGALSWTAAGTGTVNSGTAGQVPYYETNGTTLTATSSLSISTIGYVGVGTSTPQSNLHIAAKDGDGASIRVESYGSDSGFIPALVGYSAGGTAGTPIATAANDALLFIGARGYQTDTGAFGANSKVAIQLQSAEAWTSTANGTHIRFDTTQSLTTTRRERMRITNDGLIGIGTTTPSQKLSVQGNSIFSGNLSVASVTATGTLSVAGNLGVGTTSPATELAVDGAATTTVRVLTTSGTQGSCIELKSTGGTTYRLYVGSAGTLVTEAGSCK